MADEKPPDIALVLIVDDDEDILWMTAETVQRLGYYVLTAKNGPEAIDLLRKNSRINVLFTDLRMPGMQGEELARIAMVLRPGIRVIFTSGFRRPTGNAAFIRKPYRTADLVGALPPQASHH